MTKVRVRGGGIAKVDVASLRVLRQIISPAAAPSSDKPFHEDP